LENLEILQTLKGNLHKNCLTGGREDFNLEKRNPYPCYSKEASDTGMQA